MHIINILKHFIIFKYLKAVTKKNNNVKSPTYPMQKEMDKIIEIANNIQSFPSISALSTSIGKYSGIGMGSRRTWERKV